MAQLRSLYETSKALYDHVQVPMPKDGEARDTYIDTVNDLLERREQFTNGVRPPETKAETRIAREIIRLSKQIAKELESGKAAIQKDIRSHEQRKRAVQYENPYSGPTPDGVFVDSKK
ncbi:hypothetical protein ACFO4L_10335 [Bacillus daqingensis]|uniref:Flagellar protein FliT n=1 Tax=Bacillus daqingensis TaxID=872396 RepID=A0ABV9NYK0_9BACI